MWETKYLVSVSHTCLAFVVFVHLNGHTKGEENHHLLSLYHTCEIRCACRQHIVLRLVSQDLQNRQQTFPHLLISLCLSSPQVNLAIMQKQLSEMAIGHPRQPSSSSHQNGFSGGVGALGIMNNRLAETSVDR